MFRALWHGMVAVMTDERAMSKKTVYAVSSGTYSDYSVEALFTTKKLADEHLAALGDREASVETFLLFDAPPQRATVYSMNARILPDGEVVSENRRGPVNEVQERIVWEYGDFDGRPKPIMEARTLHAPYAGKDWIVRVKGTDRKRVEKAFHDRVAEARARTLGIAD